LPAYAQSETLDKRDLDVQALDINFFADSRLRYQSISQDNLDNRAEALTYRVKAGVEFEFTDWISALVEVEASDSLIDNFNNSINGQIDRPVILDVDHVDLNRLQVQSEFEGVRFTLGRQDLALDNWRFLGNWEFRQNDQTFDAARLETNLWGGRLNAGYIHRVNRHFGRNSPVGEFQGDSYILNYTKPLFAGQVSLFHYALDLETGTDSFPIDTFSSVTTGVRWQGRRHWGKGDYGVEWDLSVARQTDFANNPNQYEAYYRDVSAGFKYKDITVDLGLEVLGGDEQGSVQTPLGTLHEFQGVTDRFFLTPLDGLKDYSLDVDVDLGRLGQIDKIKLNAGFHQFTSDRDRRDYGYEFNLGVSAELNNVTFLFEYGDYTTQARMTDSGLFTSDASALIFSASHSFD